MGSASSAAATGIDGEGYMTGGPNSRLGQRHRSLTISQVYKFRSGDRGQNGTLFQSLLQAPEPSLFLAQLEGLEKEDQDIFMRDMVQDFQRLVTLHTLSLKMSRARSLDEQLSACIRAVCKVLQADRAIIFMVDHQRQELRLRVAKQMGAALKLDDGSFSDVHDEGRNRDHKANPLIPIVVFPLSDGIRGHVARTGETVRVGDAYADARFCSTIDDCTAFRTLSMLTVPIFLRKSDGSSEIIGVVQAMNKRKDEAFTEDDETLLESLATSASSFLHMSLLQEKERLERAKKEAVLDIALSLNSVLSTNELLQTVMSKVRNIFSADRCTLFLVDKEMLWSVVAQGAEELLIHTQGSRRIELPIGQGIAGHVAQEGSMLNIRDPYQDKRWSGGQGPAMDKKTGYRTRNILCGAIKDSNGNVIGVVQLINKKAVRIIPESNLSKSRGKPVKITTSNALRGCLNGTGNQLDMGLSANNGAHKVSGDYHSSGRSTPLQGSDQDISGHKSRGRVENLSSVAPWNSERRILAGHILEATASFKKRQANSAEGKESKLMELAESEEVVEVKPVSSSLALNGAVHGNPDKKRHRFRVQSVVLEPATPDEDSASFDTEDEEMLRGLFSMLAISIENSTLYSSTARAENHLQKVLSNISELVLTFDTSGALLSTNRSEEELLTLFGALNGTVTSVEMMHSRTFSTWFPDPVICAQFEKVLSGGEPFHASEYTLPSGHVVNYSVNPLTEIKGHFHDTTSVGGATLAHAQNNLPPTEGKGTPQRRTSLSLEATEDATRMAHRAQRNETQIGVVVCFDDKTPERKLEKTLKQYMAPDLVEHLLQDGKLQLGGTKQRISILFADIRGYTSFTEDVESDEVFTTLNEYFGIMVEEINKHGGVIDKFIGDALMAVFGVPKLDPQHASRACRAALDMHSKLREYNAQRVEEGRPVIKIGIGIGTGDVHCGNIGSENRFEYTVIGDAVNVASRLESSTKEYSVPTLISAATLAEITDDVEVVGNSAQVGSKPRLDGDDGNRLPTLRVREVDQIRVAGKGAKTRLYEVLPYSFGKDVEETDEETEVSKSAFIDEYGCSREQFELGVQLYSNGLELYRASQLEVAIGLFQKAIEASDDGPSHLFLERCQHLIENPPPENWDGVWDMEKVSVWTYNKKRSGSIVFGSGGHDGRRESGLGELVPSPLRRAQSDGLSGRSPGGLDRRRKSIIMVPADPNPANI